MVKVLPSKLARGLRRRQTDAETRLWYQLRSRQLAGAKFRRQQRLDGYIVDFVCFEKKTIIEIDGGQHNEARIFERDEQRTNYFKSKGYLVLRFWNTDVIENTEGVLENIKQALSRDIHPHLTSPIKGEE